MSTLSYKNINYIWNNGQTYLNLTFQDNVKVILRDILNNIYHIDLITDAKIYLNNINQLTDMTFIKSLYNWLNRLNYADFEFDEDTYEIINDNIIAQEYIIFDDWYAQFKNVKSLLLHFLEHPKE